MFITLRGQIRLFNRVLYFSFHENSIAAGHLCNEKTPVLFLEQAPQAPPVSLLTWASPFFLKSCLQRSCKTGSEKPAQKDRLRKHFGGNFPSFCLSKKRGLDRHLRIQPRCTELDGTSERRGLASEKGGFQGAIFGRVRPFSATMKRVAAGNRLSGPPHTMGVCASALR